MNPQAKLEKESSENILYFEDKLAEKTKISATQGYHDEEIRSDVDLEFYKRNGTSQNFISENDRGEVNYSDVYDLLQNIFICLQRDIEVKKEIVAELKTIYVSQTETSLDKTKKGNMVSEPDRPNRIIGVLIFTNIVFALISAYYFFDMASVIQPIGVFNQLLMFFGINFGGIAL